MLSNYQKILNDTDDSFKTDSGEIKNLKELRTMLFSQGKKFYKTYVNENENHFANWVENSFDKELGESMKNTTSFGHTLKLVDDKIKYAELWLKHNKDKEILNNYLANQSFSIDAGFSPAKRKYQTLTNFNYIHKKSTKNQLEEEVKKFKDLKHKYEFDMEEEKVTEQLQPLFSATDMPEKKTFLSKINPFSRK